MIANKFFRRHNTSTRTFKLVKGKNDPITFLPLNANIGVKPKSLQIQSRNFLTEDQVRHIYKKVESGNILNINIIKEIDQDWDLNGLDDTSGDINPYRELTVNNAEKIETVLSQMEQWSVLSNVVNYIQYDRHPKNFYNLKY